jgi:hypothetical protein
MFLPPGAVLRSRNNDESKNTSPGYWNHLTLSIGDGWLVESQEGQGVIKTSLNVYLARDYTWEIFYPVSEIAGIRAAAEGRTFIGLPYRKVAGILHYPVFQRRGMNCVIVVRGAYRHAYNRDFPKLIIPDHLSLLVPRVLTQKEPLWLSQRSMS